MVVVRTKNVLWDRGFIGFMDHVSRQADDGTEPGIRRPSSLHLNTEKPALTSLLGPSELGAALADLGTVVFAGLGGALFCELRCRSGSLLVPMSFRWAANALGYVFGFLVRVGVIPEL